MSDNNCVKCGQKGYQGLFSFECLNSACSAFVVKTNATTVNNVSGVSSHSVGPSSWIIVSQISLATQFLDKIYNSTSIVSAKVAGGAPRDWHFGNEARDIDVFVEGFDLTSFVKEFPDALIGPANKKAKNTNLQKHVISGSQALAPSHTYEESDFDVWDVKWKGQDFQIIALENKTIWYHVQSFDFGLNMIMMDRYGVFDRSLYFDKDVKNKTLTVYPNKIGSFKSLTERLSKMRAKFPGYTLEVEDM